MRTNDTIHLRVAQVLRIWEYSALVLILFSLILRFLNLERAVLVAAGGIGLILLAPMMGVLVMAVISLLTKNYKLLIPSTLILIVFIIAFLVGL